MEKGGSWRTYGHETQLNVFSPLHLTCPGALASAWAFSMHFKRNFLRGKGTISACRPLHTEKCVSQAPKCSVLFVNLCPDVNAFPSEEGQPGRETSSEMGVIPQSEPKEAHRTNIHVWIG